MYRQRIAHKLWKEGQAQQQEAQEDAITEQNVEENKAANNPVDESNQCRNDSQENIENSEPQVSEVEAAVHDPATEDVNECIEIGSNQVSDTTCQVEAMESAIQNEYVDPSEYNKPFNPGVDDMTQERYDKLVAVGFDFTIKKIPDDFICHDGQDPAILILSKTADEEEKPKLEDDQDIVEITMIEETEEDDIPNSKQGIELSVMDVTVMVDGNHETPPVPILGDGVIHKAGELSSKPTQISEAANVAHNVNYNTMEEVNSLPAQNLSNEFISLGENHGHKDTVNESVDDRPLSEEQGVMTNVVNEFSESNLGVENPIGDNNTTFESQVTHGDQGPDTRIEINMLSEDYAENHVSSTMQTTLSNNAHEVLQPPTKKRKLSTTIVKIEWEERILELIQYKIRKKSCNVPVKWKPNCGKLL